MDETGGSSMRLRWKEQIDKIYGSIMDGFSDNVCDQKNNPEDFLEFRKQLDISKHFAYKHPEFAILQDLLNKFASDWDSEIEKNRVIKNPSYMLSPYHRFLLVPDQHQDSTSPVIRANMFVKSDLPDARTVVIKLGSLERDTFRCILHEMGHFVGFRDRQKRLFNYFIPILADSICRDVYECACSYATFEELDLSSWTMENYSEDESYSKRTSTFAYHVIRILREIHPELICDLKCRYQEILNMYTDPTQNEEVTDREARSIHSGFFCSIDYVMLTTICDLLHSAEFEAKVSEITSRYSAQNCPESECELRKRVLEGFVYIKSTLSICAPKPSWYIVCENMLEEPAADVFMTKMSNMNSHQYVDLMTRQIQNIPSVNSYADMQSILAQRSVHVRIVGVTHAMGMKPSLLRELFQWVGRRVLPRTSRVYQRIIVKQQLKSMLELANKLSIERMESDFFDPTRYTFQYIKSLWSDKRYSEFVHHHRKQMHMLEYVWWLRRIPFAGAASKLWLNFQNLKNISA